MLNKQPSNFVHVLRGDWKPSRVLAGLHCWVGASIHSKPCCLPDRQGGQTLPVATWLLCGRLGLTKKISAVQGPLLKVSVGCKRDQMDNFGLRIPDKMKPVSVTAETATETETSIYIFISYSQT